jgi:hypothetical protein
VVSITRERDSRLDRAVSKGYAMAYLADVFVLPTHRCQGLAASPVRAMTDQGPGGRGSSGMLHTRDVP